MSSGTPPESEGLQFDHAEFDEAQPDEVICAGCKRPIVDAYYEVNGTLFCDSCRATIEGQFRGGGWAGKMFRAIVFGTGAAVISTIVYAAFISITKWNIALIAIGVGYFVGKAVRKGSHNMGGASFQALAMILTYLSVAVSYSVLQLVLFLEQPPDPAAPVLPPGVAANPNNPVAQPPRPPQGAGRFRKARPGVAAPAPANAPAAPVAAQGAPAVPGATLVDLLTLIGLLAGFVVAVPFLMAANQPISLLILGFAVWEAWKFNKKTKIVFTGPYWLGDKPLGGDGELAHA